MWIKLFVSRLQLTPYILSFAVAINLVNGISVNGLGEASMDMGGGHSMINATNAMMGMSTGGTGTPPPTGQQPNIHPGCIPSTGRMNNGQAMAQNLTFVGNGVPMNGQNFMATATNMTNGGDLSNMNGGGMKFTNQPQQQQYMHHN